MDTSLHTEIGRVKPKDGQAKSLALRSHTGSGLSVFPKSIKGAVPQTITTLVSSTVTKACLLCLLSLLKLVQKACYSLPGDKATGTDQGQSSMSDQRTCYINLIYHYI